MKENCKVIEDLLPLYHDGVCSEESKEFVERHLCDCQSCRESLETLNADFEDALSAQEQTEEMKALKTIGSVFKRKKRNAVLIGIGITFAVLIFLFAAYNIWWYIQFMEFYQQFVSGQDPISLYAYDEQGNRIETVDPIIINDKSYRWEDGKYEYEVKLPEYLNYRDGMVEINSLDKKQGEFYVNLHISKDLTHEYVYHVFIHTSEEMKAYFMLDPQLNQIYLEHWDGEYISYQNEQLKIYQNDVTAMIATAKSMWDCLN